MLLVFGAPQDTVVASSRLARSVYVLTFATSLRLYRVGYGDVCPGKLGWEGRVFLVLYALGCIGFFCGPVLEIVSSTWRSQLPGGILALASFVLAAGVAIFTWEGYSQGEALYASVIVGTPLLH